MQEATISQILDTSKSVVEACYGVISARWQPLKLYWEMYEDTLLPPDDRFSIFTELAVASDAEDSYSDDGTVYPVRHRYRVVGGIGQVVLVPKRDGAYYDGNLFMGELQNRWRKQRGDSIRFYNPVVQAEGGQPEQKFLRWSARIIYDAFEVTGP